MIPKWQLEALLNTIPDLIWLKDPSTSVLNSFNQMHEVQNLFVVDGSAFTAASEKNPTLSILALSWRATDYLAEEMRTGRL